MLESSYMASVTVRHLTKTYRVASKQPGLLGTLRHFIRRRVRDIHAVRDISFSIDPGEIVGFLGPNGAGKTTALKMLTGLIQPTAGQVQVVGHVPFRRQAAFLRQITLVMGQKQQLIWDLPTMDSLRINAAVYEIPPGDFRQRVRELSELLELGPELTQPVRKLSLGQRMKAELLAALLHRPKVLFLDEPTLGLDINAQSAIRGFLRQYNQRHGATILLTSHYMADITALCPRVMLIHEGRLIHDGSLEGIVERFAPYRQVRAELHQPIDRQRLRGLGEIESLDGRVVQLLVGRSALTQTVERMLAELPVADLSVSDPPIEQIIGRLFAQGAEALPPQQQAPNQEQEDAAA